MANNTLVVGPERQLGKDELSTSEVSWISGQSPQNPILASIKIRYKAQEVDGTITVLDGGGSLIKFSKPLRDITPGQAAVFYKGEVCLGGGIIKITNAFRRKHVR